MGKGKDAPEDTIHLILELQDLIREGREVLSELRVTHLDLVKERKLIADMYAKLPARIDSEIGDHVKMRVDQLGVEIAKATNTAVAGVHEKFNRLTELIAGTDQEGRRIGVTIDELVQTALKVPAHLKPNQSAKRIGSAQNPLPVPIKDGENGKGCNHLITTNTRVTRTTRADRATPPTP